MKALAPTLQIGTSISARRDTGTMSLMARGIAVVMLAGVLSSLPSGQSRASVAIERPSAPTTLAVSKFEASRAVTDTRIAALGAPPELEADAMEFSSQAAAADIVLPAPRLTGDGEIMFYARKGNIYIDIGIHGDGTYSFFCRDSGGHEFSSDDDIRVAEGVASELAKVLNSIG